MRALLHACVISLALAAPAAAQQKPQPRPAAPTISVQVTDREGAPLEGVSVVVTGPVDRSGTSGAKGTLLFRTMRAGTYRLRFEREGFVALEREIVVRAGQAAEVAVALTPAPPPPPEPEPEPAPPEKPQQFTIVREADPRVLSIPDFLDKNLIGNEPLRRTLLACTDGATARLLQIRDPLTDQLHEDVDEVLYIVAGSGVVRIRNQDTRVGPGHFGLLPRGVPHSIRREGRNPLIALSILSGSPCVPDDEGVR